MNGSESWGDWWKKADEGWRCWQQNDKDTNLCNLNFAFDSVVLVNQPKFFFYEQSVTPVILFTNTLFFLLIVWGKLFPVTVYNIANYQ